MMALGVNPHREALKRRFEDNVSSRRAVRRKQSVERGLSGRRRGKGGSW